MPGGPRLHPVAPGARLRRVPGGLPARRSRTSPTRSSAPRTCTTPPTAPASPTCGLCRTSDRSAVHRSRPRRASTTSCGRGWPPERPGPSTRTELLNSPVAPSTQLLEVAADEVRDREQFMLLGRPAARRGAGPARGRGGPRRPTASASVVVTGGPGSGKSVIALSLLGELSRRRVGPSCTPPGPGRSRRRCARSPATGRRGCSRCSSTSTSSWTPSRNGLDVLILDEAHRIRETSVNRYTRAEFRDRPSADRRAVAAARVPVFLLDEHQVVRPARWAPVEVLDAFVEPRASTSTHVEPGRPVPLRRQPGYVHWVEQLLGLRDGGPKPWEGDERVRGRRRRRAGGAGADPAYAGWTRATRARMSAGYCWPWSDPRPDGTLVPDVRIGGWARPWNVKGDRRVGGAPPSPLWATEPAASARSAASTPRRASSTTGTG